MEAYFLTQTEIKKMVLGCPFHNFFKKISYHLFKTTTTAKLKASKMNTHLEVFSEGTTQLTYGIKKHKVVLKNNCL